MGGDCLNTGCVPSKSLLASAKIAQAIRGAARFGITVRKAPIADFPKVHDYIHSVIAGIAPRKLSASQRSAAP